MVVRTGTLLLGLCKRRCGTNALLCLKFLHRQTYIELVPVVRRDSGDGTCCFDSAGELRKLRKAHPA